MKCNQICKWNSNVGCVKPYGVPCILENVSPTDKKATNADRIRAMNDEKLAEAFFNLCEKLNDGTMNDLSDLYCDGKNGCIDKDGNITCTRDMEKACVLRWLQQPV